MKGSVGKGREQVVIYTTSDYIRAVHKDCSDTPGIECIVFSCQCKGESSQISRVADQRCEYWLVALLEKTESQVCND